MGSELIERRLESHKTAIRGTGMPTDLYDLLCCPACQGDLEGVNGDLHCPSCRYTFPIVEGIPVLFPRNVKEQENDLFGRYWDSETKAELYDTCVEGGGDIFETYNHLSEIQGLV